MRSRQAPIVALDARIESGYAGGVETIIIGLASGLSELDDSEIEFVFLTYESADEWLRPYLHGSCRAHPVALPQSRRAARIAPRLREYRRRVPVLPFERPGGPPRSDGTIERLGASVVHFTFQRGFLTSVPSIYHPHDLQHLHLPDLFTTRERQERERRYRALCRQAAVVAVTSSWGRRDLIEQYSLAPEKVRVIPWAPILDEYVRPGDDSASEIRVRLGLPDAFILYPAQTWPHKNHEALFRALARLRQGSGVRIPLVCSGHRNFHFSRLDAIAHDLGIADQVVWLDFVASADLVRLYALARAVVVPTRFEAISGPVWEAFQAGTPVACSNVTALPDQVGDAAIVFDPDDIDGLAAAIRRLWDEPAVRALLAARGRDRIRGFSWDRSARTFRALYRLLAGWPLTLDDHDLLARPPGI